MRSNDGQRQIVGGLGANNALLLGGSCGTGKSSLIKAVLSAYGDQGLRMIVVDADDLGDLPEIIDPLLDLPQRFVIFCDDLSFEQGDSRYKGLKRVLEGSLELPPENVVVYASSNRRHLLPEQASDNDGARVVDTELHHRDAVEEKISLSDRFGLWLSFYPREPRQGSGCRSGAVRDLSSRRGFEGVPVVTARNRNADDGLRTTPRRACLEPGICCVAALGKGITLPRRVGRLASARLKSRRAAPRSLSRFPRQPEYLEIVDFYFRDWSGDRDELHAEAIRFAQIRGVRSGRVARQFFNSWA